MVKPILANDAKQERNSSQLEGLAKPSTRAADLLAQDASPTVKITGVKLNPTSTGLEVVLETVAGEILKPVIRSEGNTLIADINNAVLVVPEQSEFKAENPAAGVSAVTVTQLLDGQTVRVTVVGIDAVPVAIVKGSEPIASEPPAQTEPDEGEEEIVATGEKQEGYRVPNASTATKTDTPLRDIPQSVQIIPKQLLEDRQVTRIQEVAESVPGVQAGYSYGGLSSAYFIIRGFATDSSSFRDGFSDFGFISPIDLAGIEQVEFLKGPASVLYGQGSPGGIVNLTSKKPLLNPYYVPSLTIGSFDFYRPTLDISGPLNDQKTLAYRLNLAYENSGSFKDFVNSKSIFVAPAFSWQINKKTKLSFNFEYQNYDYTFDRGFLAEPEFLNVPTSRFLGEPDFNRATVNAGRASYVLEHQINDNWKFRNAFGAVFGQIKNNEIGLDTLDPDRRTVNRYIDRSKEFSENYTLQNEVTGKFKTGSIQHQVLLGLELARYRFIYDFECSTIAPIDLFNPVYGAQPTEPFTPCFGDTYGTDTVGLYIQDQITLLDNLKLLVGGRFDIAHSVQRDRIANTLVKDQTDSAFSPRLGIVYQPIEPVSLYFSYATSFNPVIFGTSVNKTPFKPERGQQFEVGIKADLIPKRLSATLAAYQVKKQNVTVDDPNEPDSNFSIQTGEQTSRGIEFSLEGRPLKGWDISFSYAYTDAYVSKDTTTDLVGEKLGGVPAHQVGLWNRYEIQSGSLKGLGFGLGLYFVDERATNLPNAAIKVPSYFRTDAALYYKRNNWKLQLNVNNLFNVDYYNTYGGSGLIPQPPRTILGEVSVEF